MAVTQQITPAHVEAPQHEGVAAVARGVAECMRAMNEAVAEARLTAAELAQDTAELAARAREIRPEHQRSRAALTGCVIRAAAAMRDEGPGSPGGH